MSLRLLLSLILFAAATAPAAAAPNPLFEASDPTHVIIRGPISTLLRTRSSTPLAGTLTTAAGEVLPVALSVRGITRRKSEICDFPPIKVEFTRPPPPTSLFAGQHKLKLATHCQARANFQQYLLLEYSAYKMYNVLTPLSFRVRLANVDYLNDDGRPVISRLGFFIEDAGDLAKRNGLRELHGPSLVPLETLSPTDGARFALFEDMIANHDWSMRANTQGEDCCHNSKLIGRGGLGPGAAIPVPYDFDFSGLVSAPYAGPPPQLEIATVRDRSFRGYCAHNAQIAVVAAQFRAARPQVLAALGATPQLEERTLKRASAFIDQFFAKVATDQDINAKLVRRCIN
jgi:hypothetical protein